VERLPGDGEGGSKEDFSKKRRAKETASELPG